MTDAYYGSQNSAYDIKHLVQVAFDIFSCYEATNSFFEKMYNIRFGQGLPGNIPEDPRPRHDKFIFIYCVGKRLFMGKEKDKVTTKLVATETVKDELWVVKVLLTLWDQLHEKYPIQDAEDLNLNQTRNV